MERTGVGGAERYKAIEKSGKEKHHKNARCPEILIPPSKHGQSIAVAVKLMKPQIRDIFGDAKPLQKNVDIRETGLSPILRPRRIGSMEVECVQPPANIFRDIFNGVSLRAYPKIS